MRIVRIRIVQHVVVVRARFLVAQDLVGGGHQLELRLRRRLSLGAAMQIRMVAPGQLAIGLADLRLGRLPGDPQHIVAVVLAAVQALQQSKGHGGQDGQKRQEQSLRPHLGVGF